MYVIVQDRGHQYKITADQERLLVDRTTAGPGETVEMPVLVYSDSEGNVEVGTPHTGKIATFKVVQHKRGKKGIAGTFRRRKDSRRRVGFRHDLTELEFVSLA